MKAYKSLFMTALVALTAVFASCSDDGYWDKYTEGGDKYSFTQSDQTNELEATATEVTVQLTRTSTNGAVTLPVTASGEDVENGNLVCPESVTFAAGSATAEYTIGLKDLEVGLTYVANLQIADDKVTENGNKTCEVSVSLKYTWVSLGKGKFWDAFFFENEYEVEILQAEGFPLYRVMHPYDEGLAKEGYVEEGVAGTPTEYIEFEVLDGDLDGLVYFSNYATGYLYEDEGDYYMVRAYHPSAFTSMQDPAYWTHSLQLDEKTFQLAPYYYVTGLGGLRNYTQTDGVITITLP